MVVGCEADAEPWRLMDTQLQDAGAGRIFRRELRVESRDVRIMLQVAQRLRHLVMLSGVLTCLAMRLTTYRLTDVVIANQLDVTNVPSTA